MSFEELDGWDPMQEDFSNNNSYRHNHCTNEPQCSLFVKNVSTQLHKDALIRIFEKFGKVKDAFIKFRPNAPVTYGFVHFFNSEDAQNALRTVNQNNRYGLYAETVRHLKNFKEHGDPVSGQKRRTSSINHHYDNDNDDTAVEGNEEHSSVNNEVQQYLRPLEIVCSGRSRTVALVPSPLPSIPSPNIDPPIPSENQPCRNSNVNDSAEIPSHHCKQSENCVYSVSEEHRHNANVPTLNHHKPSAPVRRLLQTPPTSLQCAQCDQHTGSNHFNTNQQIETPRRFASPAVQNCNPSVPAELCGEDYVSHCHHCACHSSYVCRNSRACTMSSSVCREDHNEHRIPQALSRDVEIMPDPPDLTKPTAPCGYCSKEGIFVCTLCGKPYCSKECQILDWPTHSNVCSPPLSSSVNGINAAKSQLCSKEVLCKNIQVGEPHNVVQKPQNESVAPLCRNRETASIAENKKTTELSFSSPTNTSEISDSHDQKTSASQNYMQGGENGCINGSRSDKKQFSGSSVGGFKKNDYDRESCKIKGFKTEGPTAKDSDFVTTSQRNVKKDFLKGKQQEDFVFDKTYEEDQMRHAKGRGSFRNKTPDTRGRSPNILVPQKKKASDIETVTLHVGENEEVMVCYSKTPEEFWVTRVKDMDLLREIESSLSKLMMNKIPLVHPSVDDLCASLFVDNKLYRCKIVKIESDKASCEVNYIDYGNSAVTQLTDLCCLTGKLMTYPALAVFCGLADIKPPDGSNSWKDSDVEFFSYLVDGKILKACVVNSSHPKCTIDLRTSDDLTVSSILVNQKSAEWISNERKTVPASVEGTSSVDMSSMYEVPSVLTVLKVNMEVFITPVFGQDKIIAGWPNVDEVLEQIGVLESSLQNYKADDVTHTVEEGDIAVAFSSKFKIWCRCSVIKRTKHSIKVRYIDYGDEEEVTQIIRISSKEMNVCSPVLFFKTDKLPEEIVRKISTEGFHATVMSLNSNHIEFSIKCGEPKHLLRGFPWYFGLPSEQEMSPDPKVPEQKTGDKSEALVPLKKQLEVFREKKAKPNTTLHNNSPGSLKNTNSSISDVTKNVLVERPLSSSCRTTVVVTWAKSKSDVFVQKISDISDLEALSFEMDKWCNSLKSAYIPAAGEIVCARYSVDRKWYRSHVLKALSKNLFYVSFIDYGNEENVPVEDIRALNEKFVSPQFSILVHLCNVPSELPDNELVQRLSDKTLDLEIVNADSTPKHVVFYEENEKLFSTAVANRKISGEDRKLNKVSDAELPVLKKCSLEEKIPNFHNSDVRISHIDSNKHFHVQLISSRDDYFSLKKQLGEFYFKSRSVQYSPKIDDLVCVLYKDIHYRGFVSQVLPHACVVGFIDDGFIEEVPLNCIKPLTQSFSKHVFSIAVKLHGVDKALLTPGLCENLQATILRLELVDQTAKPPTAKFLVGGICINEFIIDPDSEDSSTLPSPCNTALENPKSYPIESFKIETLPFNEELDVVFWFCEGEKYCLQKVNDLETINKMHLAVQQHCKDSKASTEMPLVGEVLCARSSGDQEWYRASVKKVINETTCEVVFIDYGNSEQVEKNSLRNLSEELAAFPVFSVSVGTKNFLHTPQIEVVYTVRVSGTEQDPVVEFIRVKCDNNTNSSPVKEVSGGDHAAATGTNIKSFMFDSFKKQSLPLNQKLDVVFCFQEGERFFVQKVSDAESIDKMTLAMQQYCGNSEVPVEEMPVVDEVICAKSSIDQKWYRACVKKVIDATTCHVMFIDYGKSEHVEKNSLRNLSEELVAFPVFAISVGIQNNPSVPIVFGNSYCVKVSGTVQDQFVEFVCAESNSSSTNSSSVEKLNELSQGLKKPSKNRFMLESLKMQDLPMNQKLNVIFCFHEDGTYFLQKESDLESVSHMFAVLQEQCTKSHPLSEIPLVGEVICAKSSIDQQWYRACVGSVLDRDRYKVIFIDYGNSEIVEKSKLCSLPSELASVPVFCAGVKVRNPPQSITFETVYSVRVSGTVQAPVVEFVDSKQDEINVNCLQVEALPCIDPAPLKQVSKRSFFFKSLEKCTLPMDQKLDVVFWFSDGKKFFLQKLSDLESISQMSVAIQHHCNKSETPEEMPVVGEIICARCSVDQQWYRACVRKVISATTCDVIFIDYGNSEEVEKSSLRNLSEELAAFPAFGISVGAKNPPHPLQFEIAYAVKVCGSIQDPVVEFITESHDDNTNSTVMQVLPSDNHMSSEKANKLFTIELFERQTVLLNQKLDVVFWFQEGDRHFLQKVSDLETIGEMTVAIQQHCSNSDVPLEMPIVGEVICARSSIDQQWYRACVRKIVNATTCDVIFIDYGNSEQIEKNSLRNLSEELAKFPVFCISVGVKSPPDPLLLEKMYTVKVSGTVQDPVVEFNSPKSGDNTNVSCSPVKEAVCNVRAVANGTDNRFFMLDSFKKQSLPLNQELDVVFLFQEGERHFLQKVSDLETVGEMIVAIQQHCSNSDVPVEMPVVGEVICARSSIDQQWYRACVRKIVNETTCDVIFIDYGNSEQVEKNSLRNLSEELAKFPVFCITVGVKSPPDPVLLEKMYTVKVSGTMKDPVVEFASAKREDNNSNNNNASCTDVKEVVCNGTSRRSFMHDLFKKQTLPINQELDVVFWFSKGDKFYLQKVSDLESVKQMSIMLQEHCTKSNPLTEMPFVGEIVCGRSSCDQQWYRAGVKKVINADTFEVSFIDYGNSEHVSQTNLCSLSEELASMPIFCITARISNLPPSVAFGTIYKAYVSGTVDDPVLELKADDNSAPVETPPSNKISFIKESKRRSFMVKSFKTQTLPINQKVDVVFWFQEGDRFYLQKVCDLASVNQMSFILEQHCSKVQPPAEMPCVGEVVCAQSSSDHQWYRACVQRVIGNGNCDVTFIDYGNSENVEKKCIRDLCKELASLPIFGICATAVNFSQAVKFADVCTVSVSGTVEKPIINFGDDKRCHTEVAASSTSTDSASGKVEPCIDSSSSDESQSPFLLSDCQYIDFPLGETSIVICSVISYDVMFCAPAVGLNVQSSADLQEKIQNFCTNSSTPDYQPQVETEMVLAKNPDDERWNRATVIEIQDDEISVCFIDHGGMASITKSQIRKMKHEFMELPIQAHVCKFGGISCNEESADALNDFLRLLPMYTSMPAVVSKDDEHFIVDIPSLKKQLQEKGLIPK